MIRRIDNFYDYFKLSEDEKIFCRLRAGRAALKADGMLALQDYEALAAVLIKFKPVKIFEIGTYLGITSNFFLNFLPEANVVSIAYINPAPGKSSQYYNNSELDSETIGSEISSKNRNRFTQIYGDSHELEIDKLLKKQGHFDLVFIDGDHSLNGVTQDTSLAMKIIKETGVICWHDANPREEYMEVRRYLENEPTLELIATNDDYIGGIAVWAKEVSKG